MSIFKETFKRFVRKQLEIRQTIIGIGNLGGAKDSLKGMQKVSNRVRIGGSKGIVNFEKLGLGKNIKVPTGAFYTNTLNRACVLRMSSGVDLRSGAQDLLEGGKYEKIGDLVGAGLAKRWVLEGGHLINFQRGDKLQSVIRKGFPGVAGKLKSGKRRSFGFAYGDPMSRADAGKGDDNYGIVPMPGIVDAQIKTKSAYGSLREAKIKFVCHNQRQLEILELLYMRPGYPILLEWGYTTYIDNEGNRSSEFPKILEFFENEVSQEFVNRKIIENKIKTGGNYDGMMGICKNFKYKARADGGYDCTTELIATGEVIESIKPSQESVNMDGLWQKRDQILILLEQIEAYTKMAALREELAVHYDRMALYSLSPTAYLMGNQMRNQTTHLENEIARSLNNRFGFPEDQDLAPYLLMKSDYLKDNEGSDTETRIKSSYIRWDALAFLFNKSFIPIAPKSGTPIFYLQTCQMVNEDMDINESNIKAGKHISPLYYGRIESPLKDKIASDADDVLDMSLDPTICLLPHQLDLEGSGKLRMGNLNQQLVHVQGYQPVPTPSNLQEEFTKMINVPLSIEEEDRMIGRIYLNSERLLKTYKELRYDDEGQEKKDFNLFDYLKKIWNDVDNACAGQHNFELSVDFERPNIVKVVDMVFAQNQESATLNMDNLVELNIQSNKSIVHNFSYHTSIPSAMTSTIAVAAQAPDSVDDLERASFAALHLAIRNRFGISVAEEEKVPDQEQQDLWKTNFTKNIENYIDGLLTLTAFKMAVMQGEYQEIDKESGDAKNNEEISKAKGVVRTVTNSASRLIKMWPDTRDGHYKGQPLGADTGTPNERSAIIPLKFTAEMDGISGLVIGNVFKIQKSRLPRAYKKANVAFVLTGESQKITAGQKWTTKMTGQMILVDDPSLRQTGGDDGWDYNHFDEELGVNYVNATRDGISDEQANIDPELENVKVGDEVYLKLCREETNVRWDPSINNQGSKIDFNDNIIGMFDDGSLDHKTAVETLIKHGFSLDYFAAPEIAVGVSITGLTTSYKGKDLINNKIMEAWYDQFDTDYPYKGSTCGLKLGTVKEIHLQKTGHVKYDKKTGDYYNDAGEKITGDFNKYNPWYLIEFSYEAYNAFNPGWIRKSNGNINKSGADYGQKWIKRTNACGSTCYGEGWMRIDVLAASPDFNGLPPDPPPRANIAQLTSQDEDNSFQLRNWSGS